MGEKELEEGGSCDGEGPAEMSKIKGGEVRLEVFSKRGEGEAGKKIENH